MKPVLSLFLIFNVLNLYAQEEQKIAHESFPLDFSISQDYGDWKISLCEESLLPQDIEQLLKNKTALEALEWDQAKAKEFLAEHKMQVMQAVCKESGISFYCYSYDLPAPMTRDGVKMMQVWTQYLGASKETIETYAKTFRGLEGRRTTYFLRGFGSFMDKKVKFFMTSADIDYSNYVILLTFPEEKNSLASKLMTELTEF